MHLNLVHLKQNGAQEVLNRIEYNTGTVHILIHQKSMMGWSVAIVTTIRQ